MKAPDVGTCTPFLKALADSTRWRIVQELLSSPQTVGQLVAHLKVSQYNVSKHLRILREAGLIETTKQGKHVHSRIVPAFRHRVRSKNQLDLGCCAFNFDVPAPNGSRASNNCCPTDATKQLRGTKIR